MTWSLKVSGWGAHGMALSLRLSGWGLTACGRAGGWVTEYTGRSRRALRASARVTAVRYDLGKRLAELQRGRARGITVEPPTPRLAVLRSAWITWEKGA
jgi:hypothetical protein